ncbi:hypothetical protein J6P52_00225 [bacterium]|nr:hypothetical protein [bacterium]
MIKIDERIEFDKQANYLIKLANNLQDIAFIKTQEQKNNYLYQMQNVYE